MEKSKVKQEIKEAEKEKVREEKARIKAEKKAEKVREKHEASVQKELTKKQEIEKKYGVNLTNKRWFQCSIEEVKYSTFTNQAQRNIDTAYVIINEDNFEILKESLFIKRNMGTRKLFYYNITSIDYDARGFFHASTSVIINTKSAEYVQLKSVKREDFDLMNNAFESYLEKIHNPLLK